MFLHTTRGPAEDIRVLFRISEFEVPALTRAWSGLGRMSVANREFFHFTSYGAGYDPTWYNHYDPAWVAGSQTTKAEPSQSSSNKEEVVELKVNLCCEGCVEKVRKKVKAMDGVANVQCDVGKNKVTVTGPVKAERVLKEVKKISHLSGSTLWKKESKK